MIKNGKDKFVGIQISPISFIDEGIDNVLDTLQKRVGVNVLLIGTVSWLGLKSGRSVSWEIDGWPDHGIPEPFSSIKVIPKIILVPLLAFDKNKNRVGYGKGYYDRFLNKYLKKSNKPVTVGIAFSFQKHHKLPVTKKDFKLDYIITEKGII